MKNALIIGASGGIGAAVADRLRTDYAVLTRSRREDGLDVTDPASVAACLSDLPELSRVFVATGILAPKGGAPEKALDQIDAAALAQVLAVNTIGPALVLKQIAPVLAHDARVGVLTARVGSIGDNRMGGWYAYRAAKAAANQIVHTAAIEIARKRKESVVVALHPGTVDTPFTANYATQKLSAAEAVDRLVGVLDGLTPAQTGAFYDWKGEEVPW